MILSRNLDRISTHLTASRCCIPHVLMHLSHRTAELNSIGSMQMDTVHRPSILFFRRVQRSLPSPPLPPPPTHSINPPSTLLYSMHDKTHIYLITHLTPPPYQCMNPSSNPTSPTHPLHLTSDAPKEHSRPYPTRFAPASRRI